MNEEKVLGKLNASDLLVPFRDVFIDDGKICVHLPERFRYRRSKWLVLVIGNNRLSIES